jgi:AcrR family transcriptional regulator
MIARHAAAKALGVSQPAPYRHFADRDALLTKVVREGSELFAAALRVAPEQAKGRDALSRMAQAYLRFGLDHPGLYKAVFASHLLPRHGTAWRCRPRPVPVSRSWWMR